MLSLVYVFFSKEGYQAVAICIDLELEISPMF